MENSRKNLAKEQAESLLEFVNAFGVDEKTFAVTICRGHKTLQQSVMRLFVAMAREMAEVTPDARNEAAVQLAKEIVAIADKHPLPFI